MVRTFLEVATMVVIWCIVAFLSCDGKLVDIRISPSAGAMSLIVMEDQCYDYYM